MVLCAPLLCWMGLYTVWSNQVNHPTGFSAFITNHKTRWNQGISYQRHFHVVLQDRMFYNTVAMYDNGTYGDQRAGDGVWSYQRPSHQARWCFTSIPTWGTGKGLDVPAVRQFNVETT